MWLNAPASGLLQKLVFCSKMDTGGGGGVCYENQVKRQIIITVQTVTLKQVQISPFSYLNRSVKPQFLDWLGWSIVIQIEPDSIKTTTTIKPQQNRSSSDECTDYYIAVHKIMNGYKNRYLQVTCSKSQGHKLTIDRETLLFL